MSPEDQSIIDAIPIMTRQSFINPPAAIDNSNRIFMRPVFHQKHNSCAQASGIGYVFTYEINYLRNLPANHLDNDENQYPTHFTYNFLNNGDPDQGSTVFDGWEIIKENGCPNIQTYGGMCVNNDATYWMTSYNDYYSALHNTIDSCSIIDLSNPEEGLANLKQWLFNHNDDNDTCGGLASFTTNMPACRYTHFPNDTSLVNDYLNPQGLNHQLTIVGYDDELEIWDLDSNGVYTNNIDVNGDSVINLLDYEKGAFKVVNSWGLNYPDNNGTSGGYVYWPFRFLAFGPDTNYSNPFIGSKAYIVYPLENYEPELDLKVKYTHDTRKRLKVGVNFGVDVNAAPPSVPPHADYYSALKSAGGEYPLLGLGNSNPMEIELDYNYFLSDEDVGKLFLDIQHGFGSGEGDLIQFGLVDYRWDETFELMSDYNNVPLITYTHNWFSIDYDLIPHEDTITSDLDLYSDMVSRFKPTVGNNSTLTIESGVTVDMYNSELIIEKGSTLVIEDSAVIHAKRGVSKIMVYGDIEIGTGVLFTADDSSGIELRFKNDSVSIDNCSFENAYVYQTIGDLNISNSDFKKSSIIASDPSQGPTQNDNYVSIKNCTFKTAYAAANAMIEIYGYKSFDISEDTIDNTGNPDNVYHGIIVHYSGSPDTAFICEISNNKIYSSFGFIDIELSGITIYSSYADIFNNNIHANGIGVQCFGNSQVNIMGNSAANNEDETQRIKNNIQYQVYASKYSFPIEMHWNAIYSGDSNDCFVYHDVTNYLPRVDVTKNNWGPSFQPDSNLLPFRHYDYEPVWGFTNGTIAYSAAQQLFETGLLQIADSNYTGAKTTFQQVVTGYPLEEPAKNSLKEVLYLEPLAGNDFSGLKNWYLTEPVIQNNAQLLSLAENLANKCDEKLENYPDAIDWYESIIENPESLEDSIFAIIDLEHLYWQMGIDTSLRSASYVGRLSQFKLKSFQAFKDHKDELFLLLHGKKTNGNGQQVIQNETDKLLTKGKLLQNVPNPFTGTTKISYILEIELADVQMDFYTYTGQLIKTINIGTKTKGTHIIDFDASGLKSGIYFYSLKVNGNTTDSKKMVILK